MLASTRLRAPIKVGCDPKVESMIGVEGNPRQMLESTDVLRSSAITAHAPSDWTSNYHSFRAEALNQIRNSYPEVTRGLF